LRMPFQAIWQLNACKNKKPENRKPLTFNRKKVSNLFDQNALYFARGFLYNVNYLFH
nr:hypothetical protein [Chlamydiota bacterium]